MFGVSRRVRDGDGDRRDGDAQPTPARCGPRLAGRNSGGYWMTFSSAYIPAP
jgi:hypothetical protein